MTNTSPFDSDSAEHLPPAFAIMKEEIFSTLMKHFGAPIQQDCYSESRLLNTPEGQSIYQYRLIYAPQSPSRRPVS